MSSRPPSVALSASCPVSLLSAELLTLILDLVIASAYEQDVLACGPDDDSVALAAHLTTSLSQVCSFWRAVVLGNPLWHATISLIPPWWHLDLDRGLERVGMLLERSAQVPLDLRIFGHADYTTTRTALTAKLNRNTDSESLDSLPVCAEYSSLFALLAPHLPRCRALQIRGVFSKENDLPFQMMKSLLDVHMPLLETFIFEGELSYYDDHMPSSGMRLFLSAPRLRQLRMVGIGINRFTIPSSPSSSPPLFNPLCPPPISTVLTTLHLSRASSRDHTSFSDLQNVLTSCPLLSTLAIYDEVLFSFPGPQAYGTCPAPALDTLFILGNMLSVSELLLFLDAPKLRELVIAPVVPSDLHLLMTVREEEEARRRAAAVASGSTSAFTLAAISSTPLRFRNLTTLTLAPAHPEAFDAIASASTCFPLVEHLILANVYLTPFKQHFAGGLGVEEWGLQDGQDGYSSEEYANYIDGNEHSSDEDDEVHGGGEWGVDDPARRGGGTRIPVLASVSTNANANANASAPGFTSGPQNPDSDDEADERPRTAEESQRDAEERRRQRAITTLFPRMLSIALTGVDWRFAQAIYDMQALRGFPFEAAAVARFRRRARSGAGSAPGDANGSAHADADGTPSRKWKSRHTIKARKLKVRAGGAGSACMPLLSVFLDTASYEAVGDCGHVWNEYEHDPDYESEPESDLEQDATTAASKKKITYFERYVQKADMWEARRKTALFAQIKELYIGQPGYEDD